MRQKVLIVDDIREIREILRRFLVPKYDVLLAQNGEEAWEIFNAEQPDLVLSDVVMPRLNGLDLCARIRTHSTKSGTPVVLITAATRDRDVNDSVWNMAAGSDAFITKPFRSEQVLKTIQKCLDHAVDGA